MISGLCRKLPPILFVTFALASAGFGGDPPPASARTLSLQSTGQVVAGRAHWAGPADASATASVWAQDAALHVRVDVRDDHLAPSAPKSYQTDSVELYVDVRPDRLRVIEAYERGVFKIGIQAPNELDDTAAVDWHPEGRHVPLPSLRVTRTATDRGYRIEAVLPFDDLRERHYTPRPEFGFDVGINDVDGVEGMRSQLMWHGGAMNWKNPKHFGSLAL